MRINFTTAADNRFAINIEPDEKHGVWLNIVTGPASISSFIPVSVAIDLRDALAEAIEQARMRAAA